MKSATNADAGARGELRRRALLHDPAAVDDRDPVAEHRRLGEVVRDEERRHVGVAQGRRPARGRRAARVRGVERRERLVEQQRAGRRASARASATRWRSPPDSVARPRARERPRRRSARAARAPRSRRSRAWQAAQRRRRRSRHALRWPNSA